MSQVQKWYSEKYETEGAREISFAREIKAM